MEKENKIVNCKICKEKNKEKNIIKCFYCGHIFRNYPLINLENFYSNVYRKIKDNTALSPETYEKRNKFIINKIKQFIFNKKKIFEVGFGYGYFYRTLLEELPDLEYCCCEISTPLSIENNERGIKTFNSSFQDIKGEKFDVIVSFDVLEHFYDPNEYKVKLLDLLDVDGIAVIQVPTDRKIHFRKPFDGHYHYFSEKSLKLLLGEEFECLMFYKTNPGETAGGKEFLTAFRRIK